MRYTTVAIGNLVTNATTQREKIITSRLICKRKTYKIITTQTESIGDPNISISERVNPIHGGRGGQFDTTFSDISRTFKRVHDSFENS